MLVITTFVASTRLSYLFSLTYRGRRALADKLKFENVGARSLFKINSPGGKLSEREMRVLITK